MPKISTEQKHIMRGFFLVMLVAWVDQMASGIITIPLKYLTSILYAGVIVAWIRTVQERVIHVRVRRILMTSAVFLIGLFVLRICRWGLFAWKDGSSEYLWYAYYLVFVVVPAAFLQAALCIDGKYWRGQNTVVFLTGFASAILGILVMTNHFHGFLFQTAALAQRSGTTIYGPLYYLVVIWCLVLSSAALVVMVIRCSLPSSRRLWFWPVGIGVLCFFLIVLYFLEGGSPTLFGMKLYQIQEVYAFSYIGIWESCFQIGLIPTNTGYADLFSRTTLGTFITDQEGQIAFKAHVTYIPAEDRIRAAADYGLASVPGSLRLRSEPIRNGRVFWTEDLKQLITLQGSLREMVEQISAENTILAYENEIREQTQQIAVKNRLYDRIAEGVRPQVHRLELELKRAEAGDPLALQKAAVLGAYIKRYANLRLIAEEKGVMPLSELCFAIRESVDYLMLTDIKGDVRMEQDAVLPGELMADAYFRFEAIVESIMETGGSLMVNVSAADGFRLHLMTDAALMEGPEPETPAGAADLHKTVLHEDGITYVTFFERGE